MRKILLAVLAVTLFTSAAFASPISVTANVQVWNGFMTHAQQQAALSNTPGGAANWTFTYTGAINFNNPCAFNTGCNTFADFGFNSGNVSLVGPTLTTFLGTSMSSPNSPGNLGDGNASFLVFTFTYGGTAAGSLSHDDGASLYGVGGTTLVSSPDLTSSLTNTFTYNGTGTYKLVYVEANSSPAQLILTSDTAFIQTPEPSSFLLLGSGLLGLAGVIRRKLTR